MKEIKFFVHGHGVISVETTDKVANDFCFYVNSLPGYALHTQIKPPIFVIHHWFLYDYFYRYGITISINPGCGNKGFWFDIVDQDQNHEKDYNDYATRSEAEISAFKSAFFTLKIQ